MFIYVIMKRQLELIRSINLGLSRILRIQQKMGCGVALTYLQNKNQIYLEKREIGKDVKPSTKQGAVNTPNSIKIEEVEKMESQNKNALTKPVQVSYQIPVTFDSNIKHQTNQENGKIEQKSVLSENKANTIQPTSACKTKLEDSKITQVHKISKALVRQKKQHKIEDQIKIKSSIKDTLKQSVNKQLKEQKITKEIDVHKSTKIVQNKKQQGKSKENQKKKKILVQTVQQQDISDREANQTGNNDKKQQDKKSIKTDVRDKQIKNENTVKKSKSPLVKQNIAPQSKSIPEEQVEKKKQNKVKISMQKKLEQEKALLQKEQKKIQQMKKKLYEQQQKKLEKQATKLKQIYVL